MSFTLYCAAQRGDTRNTLYPRRRVITGFSDLQTAARFDHVAAEFEGSRRSLDGFRLADCIVLDVDNDHGQIVQPEQIAEDFSLTRREAELLPFIARGRSARVIADALFVSENTIRTHTRRILEKTDLHSKQQVIDLIEKYR